MYNVHPMYNCTLVPYSRKSKYRSYRVSFEYPLASKMVTKANSTPPGDFNTTTLLSYDVCNCSESIFAQINKQFKNFP